MHDSREVLNFRAVIGVGSESSGKERSLKDEEMQALLASTPKATFWTLIVQRDVLVSSLVTLVSAAALSALEPTLPAHVEKEFDASSLVIGFLFMAESVVYGITSPIAGYIGDRFTITRHPTMVLGLIALGISMPFIALPDRLWLQFIVTSAMAVAVSASLTPTLPILAGEYARSFQAPDMETGKMWWNEWEVAPMARHMPSSTSCILGE